MVVGDLNNDNYLDLAITNFGTDNIRILFGNVYGTFAEERILSTKSGSHPISIVSGYFNDDLFLDIAVAYFGTNQIEIFLNNLNGTFLNRLIYSLHNASPYAIATADFKDDLVLVNKGQKNIGVFRGYGDRTFANPQMYSTMVLFHRSL